ncbi:MAG TPA: hypothetical protein VFN76_10965 [Candidatus Limnocylindria bacterium]|nr:hypothetical protein [Candidatus Limnocylindria bacterium]
MSERERSYDADRAPVQKSEVDALLVELDEARRLFEAADRRARTYLARRGVLDQTSRDIVPLLLAALHVTER